MSELVPPSETCGDCGKGEPFALICANCWSKYYRREDAPADAEAARESRAFSDFVRTQINPILGGCFNEAAGRCQFGAGVEYPHSSLRYLVGQTDELVRRLGKLVASARDLKGSRNFPGESPSPNYDQGVEDCVRSLLDELGVGPH